MVQITYSSSTMLLNNSFPHTYTILIIPSLLENYWRMRSPIIWSAPGPLAFSKETQCFVKLHSINLFGFWCHYVLYVHSSWLGMCWFVKCYTTMLFHHLNKVLLLHYYFVCRADVNAADNFLWTPLHHACHSGEVSWNVICYISWGVEMLLNTYIHIIECDKRIAYMMVFITYTVSSCWVLLNWHLYSNL